MKNCAFTIMVLLGLSTSVFAQKKGDVEFGVNIGYNNSSVSDSYDSSDTGSGFNLGGFK
jgi:hypothetical protein